MAASCRQMGWIQKPVIAIENIDVIFRVAVGQLLVAGHSHVAAAAFFLDHLLETEDHLSRQPGQPPR